MAKVLSFVSILIHLMCFSNGSDHTNFKSEYDPIRIDILSKRNFNISKIVNEVLLGDWTNNKHCFVELNAIKDGLKHFDGWALGRWFFISFFLLLLWVFSECIRFHIFEVVDAWGKLPSGILSGNSFEPGSFSQCFHIERNGADYKTQYCIGTLIFQPKKVSVRNKVWTR